MKELNTRQPLPALPQTVSRSIGWDGAPGTLTPEKPSKQQLATVDQCETVPPQATPGGGGTCKPAPGVIRVGESEVTRTHNHSMSARRSGLRTGTSSLRGGRCGVRGQNHWLVRPRLACHHHTPRMPSVWMSTKLPRYVSKTTAGARKACT